MTSDSAGVPWDGRHFDDQPFADDDGSAPPALLGSLTLFARGDADAASVVDAIRTARLLIPLIAKLGDTGIGEHGRSVDKSAELAIVTVAGPDGRRVQPVFSSVDAMRLWNPDARPVPSDAVRVALAAASEATELVVLDPGSPTEFAIRRPAVWAIAQQLPWTPSFADPEVRAAFAVSVDRETDVVGIEVASGDPTARLAAPELLVTLAVRPGLDQATLAALLTRLQRGWERSAVIADRVDSLSLMVISAE